MLHYHIITQDDDPALERFFEAYDQAFILEDEKETLDGFRQCLALNSGRSGAFLLVTYNSFREYIVMLTDGEEGPVVGGMNFIVFHGENKQPTISLNYIFVMPGYRKKGYFKELYLMMLETAYYETEESPDMLEPLVFIEVNDPASMSPEDYARDSNHSGIDQKERLSVWERMGARAVDIEYIQPPISGEAGKGVRLILGVLGTSEPDLDPRLLADHLRRFFGVTVLKGRVEPDDVPVAAEQLGKLEEACAEGRRIGLKSLWKTSPPVLT